MKQKIFIGSSSESAEIAACVKKIMEPEFECSVWYDEFFEMNESTYQNLIKKAISFDYAIFIGGPDDLVYRKSKKEKRKGARDNIYFELGLYAGILSPERSYFLIHKNCKVASDLLGITLETYKTKKDLQKCCKNLQKRIKEEEKISRIALLPSTGLAFGYYDNFVRQACLALENAKTVAVEGQEYDVASMKKELDIIFPNTIVQDWKDWAALYYKEKGFQRATLKCDPRDFTVYIDGNDLINGRLRVIDIPQTLRASFYCVDQIAAKNYEGEKEFSKLSKKREIRNFKKTLNILILQDSYAIKYVKKFL